MSDSERWIIKALNEASGEVRELLVNALLGDAENVQLLIRDAWERETVAAWQLAHLIFRDPDPLPLHSLEWLEQRHEQVPDAYEQVRQFADLRGQITGVLSMISSREWEQSAHHRFRGPNQRPRDRPQPPPGRPRSPRRPPHHRTDDVAHKRTPGNPPNGSGPLSPR